MSLKLSYSYVDDMLVRMAHHSTAIEGNALTEYEAKCILLDGIIPRAMHEREFYEVKKNGQIFSVRAIFAYDKNYNFLSYQREIKALYPNILSEDWLALIHVRKHRNSGVKINVQGAGVFDYNGKLVTKGPLSKDDNRFVDIKFTSDRYYVAEYVYFYAYGSHFDESEKRW